MGRLLKPLGTSIPTRHDCSNTHSQRIKLRLEEVQRAAGLPTGWLPQDRPRLIPDVLGDNRLFRGISAFLGCRLREPHYQPVVVATKVVLRASRTSDVEVAAIETVSFAVLQELLHGVSLLLY